MNKELWDKIEQFDFDNPPTEYSFSTRLAKENFWTKASTERAILEYKKFMYLAATSEFMVSPSPIIDTVWHQHLIYTQLYNDFCTLIGKQVQHIPSTHNKEDFQKFNQAKERTVKLYENIFGKQPKDIWDYNDMYESLNLKKAPFKIRTIIIIGIFIFITLIPPFFFFLKPIFVSIDNPYFIGGYLALIFAAFTMLELYNLWKLKQITKTFDKESFIYHLKPSEMVYFKTQQLSSVINGVMNELLMDNIVKINSNSAIELVKSGATKSHEQLQTTAVLKELGKSSYPLLLNKLRFKPLFKNIQNSTDAFKKYFNKSLKFGKLFYLNFAILSFLLMLGFIRLTTGILRDKPVLFIAIALIVLTVFIVLYLNRLTKLICTRTIPELYKNEILPVRPADDDCEWNYFLLGTAALTASFIPLVNYVERQNNRETSWGVYCGSNCGSSCSSCGSSCSSCGGCGGGD